MVEVNVYSDANAVAEAAAELVVALAREAVEARGRFAVALSGGSTPAATYARLAQDDLAGQIGLGARARLLGRRAVRAADHPTATLAWRGNAARPRAHPRRKHPPYPRRVEPVHAADAYERSLRTFFGEAPRSIRSCSAWATAIPLALRARRRSTSERWRRPPRGLARGGSH
jgi:6-phosphogluconolactonase